MREAVRRGICLTVRFIFLVCALFSSVFVEARGYVGCSPGRACTVPEAKAGSGDRSIIASDALERHPLTHKPLGFFPNYPSTASEVRPVLPAKQTLRWAEMLAYSLDLKATVTLNPDHESSTTMESLQQGGVPFFPARQTVTLYLLWTFEDGHALFNKEPIVMNSDVPLTGFPPAFGPNYQASQEVVLFDRADPDGSPVMTLPPPRVGGDVERLFDVQMAKVNERTFRVGIKTRRPGLTVPSRILSAGTPAVKEISALPGEVRLSNSRWEKVVTMAPPSEPCFDYMEVWAVSLDPDHLGMGVAMQMLPNGKRCQQPDPMATASSPQTARVGQRVTLKGKGRSRKGVVHYSWVAPQGVTLKNPTSANPTFVVPETEIERELIFTLFVDDGVNISPPSATVVVAMPRPARRGARP